MRSSLSPFRVRGMVSLARVALNSIGFFLPIFLSLTCVLLAIGSTILGLAWVFFNFFVGMAAIDLYTWLPLIVLLSVIALFIPDTDHWTPNYQIYIPATSAQIFDDYIQMC